MHDEMATFVGHLLHSATVTHFQHWSTSSYAQHVALQAYYDGIVDLTDQLAEAYMGKYEKLTRFNVEFINSSDPVTYLSGIKGFVGDARQHLPDDSELQNLIDEIADLINTTLYKLRFLK